MNVSEAQMHQSMTAASYQTVTTVFSPKDRDNCMIKSAKVAVLSLAHAGLVVMGVMEAFGRTLAALVMKSVAYYVPSQAKNAHALVRHVALTIKAVGFAGSRLVTAHLSKIAEEKADAFVIKHVDSLAARFLPTPTFIGPIFRRPRVVLSPPVSRPSVQPAPSFLQSVGNGAKAVYNFVTTSPKTAEAMMI